jgi:hypothetical protein
MSDVDAFAVVLRRVDVEWMEQVKREFGEGLGDVNTRKKIV